MSGAYSALNFARAAGAVLTDFVYPRRCATCRRRGTWLCADCAPLVSLFLPPVCPGCGVPVATERCHCDDMGPALVAVRSIGPFDGWLREAILRFKYEDEWGRVDHLGASLATVIVEMPQVDALVPVPLHPSRLRRRGYNQSALLAQAVSRQLGIPTLEAVQRTRATSQQARLSGPDRARNVAGAFAIAPGLEVQGMRLVVIDDVITTGATINACASVLSAGGATRVSAATLARQL